jgi:magnesium transporter
MNTDLIILDKFISEYPKDAARILEHLSIEDTVLFLQEIPENLALHILNNFELFTAIKCLKLMGNEKSAMFLGKISNQVVSGFLRQINPEARKTILSMVPKDFSTLIQKLINYPQDSAGALADPNVLSLPDDITVKQALDRVLKNLKNTIYYIYILNREKVLVGVTNLRDLMSSKPESNLSSVMQTKVLSVLPELHYLAIMNHPGWQKYHTLPVVEESGFFLGVIRYEVLKNIERESRKNRQPQQAVKASNALGELYQIGLSGLIRSAARRFKDQAG